MTMVVAGGRRRRRGRQGMLEGCDCWWFAVMAGCGRGGAGRRRIIVHIYIWSRGSLVVRHHSSFNTHWVVAYESLCYLFSEFVLVIVILNLVLIVAFPIWNFSDNGNPPMVVELKWVLIRRRRRRACAEGANPNAMDDLEIDIVSACTMPSPASVPALEASSVTNDGWS